MKVSLSTLSFDEYDFEQFLQVCTNNKISGIEVRLGSGKMGKQIEEGKNLESIGKMYEEAGVKIFGVLSSIDICDNSIHQLDGLKKILPMTSAIGANGVRVFLGNFIIGASPIDYDGIVTWLKAACDMAAEYGIDICVETHNEFSSGKVLDKLMKDVSRDNIKIIWDIMHPIEADETPMETYNYLKGRIDHLHIKDGVVDPDGGFEYIYTAMGEGVMPIEEIKAILRENNEELYCSLEWEEEWKQSLKDANLDHLKVIKEYSDMMYK